MAAVLFLFLGCLSVHSSDRPENGQYTSRAFFPSCISAMQLERAYAGSHMHHIYHCFPVEVDTMAMENENIGQSIEEIQTIPCLGKTCVLRPT
jgi:hypothetical protein